MGITNAFDWGRYSYISQIIHRTTIEVTEEGTEAAEVVMDVRWMIKSGLSR